MTETKLIYKIGNFSVLFLQEQDQTPNVTFITLLFFLVLTLILNSFVLLSLLLSNLRTNPYNISVATLAAVSVLDGIFNVTSSIVFHASWEELPEQYGEANAKKWCRANAITLQLTGMVQSFALAVLVYDRQCVLFAQSEEDIRKKDKILKWILFISVVVSTVMTLPIWFGIFSTSLFKNRMSCSPTYVTAKPVTILLAILTSITYLSIWLVTLRVSFRIVKKVLNNRRRLLDLSLVAGQRTPERNSLRSISNSNTEVWSRVSGKIEEHTLCILTGLLVVSFMLGVWPNIIAVQITQFYSTYDESLDTDFFNETFSPLDLRQIRTDIFDSVFSWTRYGYNVFLPIIVLFIHNEVRKQCKLTFCCFVEKSYDLPVSMKRKKNESVADNAIPVLFATAEGLHLRILNNNSLYEEPSFTVKFCDLVLKEVPENRNETREMSVVASHDTTVKEPNFSKTFVFATRKSFCDTYVKLKNGFDLTGSSNNRKPAMKHDIIEEHSGLH